MKKASLALIIGTSLVLSACGNDKKETNTEDQVTVDAAEATVTAYTTTAEQHSYALGASMVYLQKLGLNNNKR